MKKLLSFILIATMLFVMITACGEAETPVILLEVETEEGFENVTTLPALVDPEEELEIVEIQSTPFSINASIFTYLDKTPEEVTELAGEYIETIWFTGWWHRFGDYWFVFDDAEQPVGQSVYIFCEISDIIDGIVTDIDVEELDELFGHQANFFAVEEGSELFTVGTLIYKYQGIEITINAEPNTKVNKETLVRLRII
jgi:hypothetical protein